LGLSTTRAIPRDLGTAGLVRRTEDQSDRRRTIVCLSDAHREAIAGWAEQALAPLRATLARLPAPARAQFIAGWRILHEEATRAAPIQADVAARPSAGQPLCQAK
jgi:DNA-binding MarR family transcriptional regulator